MRSVSYEIKSRPCTPSKTGEEKTAFFVENIKPSEHISNSISTNCSLSYYSVSKKDHQNKTKQSNHNQFSEIYQLNQKIIAQFSEMYIKLYKHHQ